MKNVICIDLTKFNNEKLVELAKNLDIDVEAVLHNKKVGFVKLFIYQESNRIIAFTTKNDKNNIQFTTYFKELLSSIEPIQLPKKQKGSIEMDIDTILDKISKYGMESLTINERKFLDDSSKQN